MSDTPITAEVEAFALGLEKLAAWYRANPHAPLPLDFGDGDGRIIGKVYAIHTATELADLARRLGGHRPKDYRDNLVRVGRDFGGGVNLRLIADRDLTCERVQTGTKTVVKTALACIHCDEPITREDIGGGVTVWLHVPAEGDPYIGCDGTITYEDAAGYDVGEVATPPSFDAQTVEEPVYEWSCPDSILGDELAEARP